MEEEELLPDLFLSDLDFPDREELGCSLISVSDIFLPSDERPPGKLVLRCMVKRLMLNGMLDNWLVVDYS